jgi:hypothetical protein
MRFRTTAFAKPSLSNVFWGLKACVSDGLAIGGVGRSGFVSGNSCMLIA